MVDKTKIMLSQLLTEVELKSELSLATKIMLSHLQTEVGVEVGAESLLVRMGGWWVVGGWWIKRK